MTSLNNDFVPYYLEKFGSNKASTTIHIFNREGLSCYWCYGQDAHLVASEIFKSNADLKMLKKDEKTLDYLTISGNQFEPVIKELLIVRQYRVEVYRSSKSTELEENQWELYAKASPGNTSEFEEVLFSSESAFEPINILALKTFVPPNSTTKMLAAAYCDTAKQVFVVCEFTDTDNFSNLESLLVQVNPKECVLPAGDQSVEYTAIRKLLTRWKIVISEGKRSTFHQSAGDWQTDVDRLLRSSEKKNATAAATMNLHRGMNCVSALISFLNLAADSLNAGKFKIRSFTFNTSVKLDLAALKALQIVPVTGDSDATLFSVLNKCRTSIGSRLLEQWIRQPLLDQNKIEERLHIVEAFVNDVDICNRMHNELLRRIPDLQAIVKKILRNKGSLQDCHRMYQAVKIIPAISKCLLNDGEMQSQVVQQQLIEPLLELERDLDNFVKLVENTLDLEAADKGEYMVDADFDDTLKGLRKEMEEKETKMMSQLPKISALLQLDSDKAVKLEKTNVLGYHFRVSRKDERSLRSNHSIIILETHKAGLKCTTASLEKLNAEYLALKKEYDSSQENIVGEILGVVSTYTEVINRFSDVVATIDVLVALAVAATGAPVPYVRPVIKPKGSGILKLKGARHPCLESQDQIAFIPNDVTFDKEEKMFYFITGPNMGGKSTFIRQVGVIVLMAQIGSFVPCDSAEISIVDSINTRIGGSDTLLTGNSTFMAEMLETAAILQSATADSLVIIDELGRGTSTYDGFGLAYEIAREIATKIGCFCLFASHFHEITELATEVKTVGNLHVTAAMHEDSVALLYKVAEGVCDKSFAIHLAEMLKFPAEVVQTAKKELAMLENGNGLMKAIELANSNLSDEEFVIEYAKLSGLDDLSNEMETN